MQHRTFRLSLAAALAAALLATGLLATATLAHEFKQGSIEIDHPWARPTDPMAKTAAAYFTLKNAGADADKLVGVSVSPDISEKADLHVMQNKDGMMSMQHVDSIPIPAKGSTALKPGGYHVMFTNLKAPFTAGKKFPLDLTFEKAGKVTVEVWVEKPKDGSMGGMQHDHNHDMGGMKMDGMGDMKK